jgi:L-asparaginase
MAIKNKTIVLTGAMQPATMLMSDAVFNVGFALAAVQTLAPSIYIAINGNIFHPNQVSKNHQLKRFEVIK